MTVQTGNEAISSQWSREGYTSVDVGIRGEFTVTCAANTM